MVLHLAALNHLTFSNATVIAKFPRDRGDITGVLPHPLVYIDSRPKVTDDTNSGLGWEFEYLHTFDDHQRVTMRISIREQLGFIVLLTSLIALAVVAVATVGRSKMECSAVAPVLT